MTKFQQGALWARDNKASALGLALLAALALASILQGFRYAVIYSTDFQWSPTVLLMQGLNPYEVALSGDYAGKILMSQFPPYLPLLYIVFYPLGFVPYTAAKFLWALINFGLSWASLLLLGRLFRLSLIETLTLAGLFFISTPYRNAVGNGQTSMLCLLTLLIAWMYQQRNPIGAGLSLSLLVTKYSFAPPVVLWLLLRRRATLLIVSLLSLIAGWLLFSFLCRASPVATLAEPLKVANMYAESEGGGDIMTLALSFGWERSLVGGLKLGSVLGILTTCLWIAALKVRESRIGEPEILVCLCLISLLAIRHLAYDFVFVAPVAALAFGLPRLWRIGAFALVAYLWFGVKLLDSFGVNGKGVEMASFLALNGLVLIVLASGRAAPPRGT